MQFRPALIALTLTTPLMLSACASTPDPAEVCTAEWITPRTTAAIDDIRDRTGSTMKSLQKVAERYLEGRQPGPLQLLSLANSMKGLERELKNGSGMRTLKTVAGTCNDPAIITDSLTNVMQLEGLPQNMINFVTSNPIYQSLVNEAIAEATQSPPQS